MLRPSRAGYTQDTFELQCRYVQDTYPGLVLFALLPKELKAIRLFITRVGRHVWRTAASVCCVASCVPLGPARGRAAASVCCGLCGQWCARGWHQAQWWWHGLNVFESQVLQVNELLEMHARQQSSPSSSPLRAPVADSR
jgi:hypothetical protein